MLRRIGGVIAGIIILALSVQVAEMGVHAMHPFPPGTNTKDFNQIKKFVATLPLDAFLLVLAGHLVGTVLGCFAAARIGRSRVPAYVLGAAACVLGVVNMIIIPQPVWFAVAAFVIYIGGAIIGARLGAGKITTEAQRTQRAL